MNKQNKNLLVFAGIAVVILVVGYFATQQTYFGQTLSYNTTIGDMFVKGNYPINSITDMCPSCTANRYYTDSIITSASSSGGVYSLSLPSPSSVILPQGNSHHQVGTTPSTTLIGIINKPIDMSQLDSVSLDYSATFSQNGIREQGTYAIGLLCDNGYDEILVTTPFTYPLPNQPIEGTAKIMALNNSIPSSGICYVGIGISAGGGNNGGQAPVTSKLDVSNINIKYVVQKSPATNTTITPTTTNQTIPSVIVSRTGFLSPSITEPNNNLLWYGIGAIALVALMIYFLKGRKKRWKR